MKDKRTVKIMYDYGAFYTSINLCDYDRGHLNSSYVEIFIKRPNARQIREFKKRAKPYFHTLNAHDLNYALEA